MVTQKKGLLANEISQAHGTVAIENHRKKNVSQTVIQGFLWIELPCVQILSDQREQMIHVLRECLGRGF